MPRSGAFERTELAGGLRILTERMPSVRSVTLGIWAGVGSRDETPRLAGASHYLEHLLFKGTKRRSARDIAELMDAVGGNCSHEEVVELVTRAFEGAEGGAPQPVPARREPRIFGVLFVGPETTE